MRKRGNQPKIEKVVQYFDDQKNYSALAKIHEMSITTKQRGKSPTQHHHVRFRGPEPEEDKNKNKQTNDTFNRRRQHFATVKSDKIDLT